MDELKREVQHRGAEVELTRQELQTTIDLKVYFHYFMLLERVILF